MTAIIQPALSHLRALEAEAIHVMREVAAQFHVAVEAELGVLRGLLVDAADGLDVGVVRRHAGANEPPRSRQAVEHVDLDAQIGVRLGLQEMPGRVEARRPGTDDRHPQRMLIRADCHAAHECRHRMSGN